MTRIVFDIGGTKMRVAKVEDGALGVMSIAATPTSAVEGLSALKSAILSIAGGEEIEAIAGGVPGVMENGVLFRMPNLPAWEGMRLLEELKTLATHVEIRNDSALACLGEAVYGAGKGAHIVAYIGIGTGVGGARAVSGVLDETSYNFEPGQEVITEKGETLNDLVSGGALARESGVHASELPASEYEKRLAYLATGIVNVLVFWSPDVLVLGGSLMNEETGYRLEPLIAMVKEKQHMFPKLPEIRVSALGDINGLMGAVALLGAS